MFRADIYLIDTAVNDVVELCAICVNNIKKHNELLIHLISNFNSNPSIIYIGSSTRIWPGHLHKVWTDSRGVCRIYIYKYFITCYFIFKLVSYDY